MSLEKLVKVFGKPFSMNDDKKLSFDERFEKAAKAVESRSRGLSQVRERVMSCDKISGVLHEFYIFDHSETSFKVYAFYHDDAQLKREAGSSFEEQLQDLVFFELKNVGRGNCSLTNVSFEFDSHENVKSNYKGNYFNRFR